MKKPSNIIGVIPARYASSRFPGKLLADLEGLSVLQRVYQQAMAAGRLAGVYIATDDQRIYEHAASFGAKVFMTSPDIDNGTKRCHAALAQISELAVHGVINIQGDEPFIRPDEIDTMADALRQAGGQIVTLATRITDRAVFEDPHTVKLVKDRMDRAMYFSRQPIPHIGGSLTGEVELWAHIGMYGFRVEVLHEIVELPASALEQLENLEQLRWLENGYHIRVIQTTHEHIGIDTPEDLVRARQIMREAL